MIDFLIGWLMAYVIANAIINGSKILIKDYEARIKHQEEMIEFWSKRYLQEQQDLYG